MAVIMTPQPKTYDPASAMPRGSIMSIPAMSSVHAVQITCAHAAAVITRSRTYVASPAPDRLASAARASRSAPDDTRSVAHDEAAVDLDGLARHVVGVRPGQERHDAGDVVRRLRTAQRNVLDAALPR